MKGDRLDICLRAALAVAVIAAVALPFLPRPTTSFSSQTSASRSDDRQQLQEARLFMIRKRYEPVENLMQTGNYQQALLKLEEIDRSAPAAAHAAILRGELLFKLGSPAGAVTNFATGVRLEGGYVDRNSPLSRRNTINSLVESVLPKIRTDANLQPVLKDIRYLQSRLAGGCE